jgi:hypothetical protein
LRFATVTVIGSGRLLSSDEILPMLGTLGQSFGFASELPLGPELAFLSMKHRQFIAKRVGQANGGAEAYERGGVREYIVAVPRTRELVGFLLTPGGFRALETDSDGVLRCGYFPGLWLDMKALWDLDLARMNAVLQQGLARPEHADFAAQLAKHKPPSQS